MASQGNAPQPSGSAGERSQRQCNHSCKPASPGVPPATGAFKLGEPLGGRLGRCGPALPAQHLCQKRWHAPRRPPPALAAVPLPTARSRRRLARRPRGQPCPHVRGAHCLAVAAGGTDAWSVRDADARQPGLQPLAAAGHRPARREQPAHPRLHAPARPGPLCRLPGPSRLGQPPHQPGALGEQRRVPAPHWQLHDGPRWQVPDADSRRRQPSGMHAGRALCMPSRAFHAVVWHEWRQRCHRSTLQRQLGRPEPRLPQCACAAPRCHGCMPCSVTAGV